MDKIIEIFKKLKLKLRYSTTQEKLKVPYAIYTRSKEPNQFADNDDYIKIFSIRVEVYFDDLEEQMEIEKKLEEEFKKNNITFDKSEDIPLDEGVIMIIYYLGGLKDVRRK